MWVHLGSLVLVAVFLIGGLRCSTVIVFCLLSYNSTVYYCVVVVVYCTYCGFPSFWAWDPLQRRRADAGGCWASSAPALLGRRSSSSPCAQQRRDAGSNAEKWRRRRRRALIINKFSCIMDLRISFENIFSNAGVFSATAASSKLLFWAVEKSPNPLFSGLGNAERSPAFLSSSSLVVAPASPGGPGRCREAGDQRPAPPKTSENHNRMPCGSSLEAGQDVCISGWEYSIIFTGGERFRKGW